MLESKVHPATVTQGSGTSGDPADALPADTRSLRGDQVR